MTISFFLILQGLPEQGRCYDELILHEFNVANKFQASKEYGEWWTAEQIKIKFGSIWYMD